ncbi:kinesin-related protein 4 [Impatiens glandulifera]|uniref:kinesin-related protein 4 n=1 Tax=Impatiens glandulifera TaxID=253017 RepID=UPI001FB0C616|nr:kinesin-related protein 4 [Impatiens glandulifera]
MEGAGARLGRPSSRYAPTSTVFSGPVRKWKKKWSHPSINIISKHNHSNNYTTNGNDTSNLVLFKWIPVTQSQNNGSKGSTEDGSVIVEEEPTKRRFRYFPVAVLEDQKDSDSKQANDEEKSNENIESSSANNGLDEKPDINDATIEENQDQDDNPVERQDTKENLLDLNLGLKANDGDHRMDTKMDDDDDETEE